MPCAEILAGNLDHFSSKVNALFAPGTTARIFILPPNGPHSGNVDGKGSRKQLGQMTPNAGALVSYLSASPDSLKPVKSREGSLAEMQGNQPPVRTLTRRTIGFEDQAQRQSRKHFRRRVCRHLRGMASLGGASGPSAEQV